MTYSFISFYILDTNLILNSDTALSGDFILICFFWSFLIFVFFFFFLTSVNLYFLIEGVFYFFIIAIGNLEVFELG